MAEEEQEVALGCLGRTYEVLGDVGRARGRHRVRMCEEEHAIDNLRPLETIIMSYLFREGMVLCFATRR